MPAFPAPRRRSRTAHADAVDNFEQDLEQDLVVGHYQENAHDGSPDSISSTEEQWDEEPAPARSDEKGLSSLRYWLLWGVPIEALVLVGAYMIAPAVGLPSWNQALRHRTQAASPASAPSHQVPATAVSAAPVPTSPVPTSPSTDDGSQGQDGAVGTPSALEAPAGTDPSTVVPPAASPADASPADASASQTPPADVLAGPVDDAVLQQLLTKSMPERLGVTKPHIDESPSAQSTVQAAWQALSADLNAGGWSEAHMQAHELTSDETAERTDQLPPHTTVVIMWSALSAAGDLQDRQMSAVRMDTTTTPATPQQITTL